MAELLIKAVDATHGDPEKDAKGCYKRGDVVGVAPNGWEWGSLELKAPAAGGKFVVVKITDVTRQQVVNWVRNHWDTEIDGTDGGVVTVRRRRVHINWTALPNPVRNALNSTGQYTTTWAAIREYVRNKQTAETAQNSPIE
jgi:hypothetical protein